MQSGNRVIVDDHGERFWVTIKKFVGDKFKAIDDRTNRMIELPQSAIVAYDRQTRIERRAQRRV